jgi:Asp-tRNA(Asn)/Glu-tRNA(Gln) amidotransferase A subunit family amidase
VHPVVVKGQLRDEGLRTTAGSQSLANFVPTRDAFVVAKIRDAGAIVLFKSNMAEFAFTPLETVGSMQPGYTFNPYALNHTTAGSSGGTAAAVAASFGAVGLGTDTGNSIRGPSSHQSLVGIRSTMGLVSRSGVVPLNFLADIAGPMTRTVEDAAVVLRVIAGSDPGDPVTLTSEGHIPPSYLPFLKKDSLKGVRLGVLHAAYDRPTADCRSVGRLQERVEGIESSGCRDCRSGQRRWDYHSVHRMPGPVAGSSTTLNITWLKPARRSRRSMRSSKAECFIRRFDSDSNARKRMTLQVMTVRGASASREYRKKFGDAVLATMTTLKLDAFVYPTWSNPPAIIGDVRTNLAGDNSQVYSPTTGFPAITVPMGFTRGGTLPAGLTIFGRPWDEGRLFAFAYAYEQTTHHRKPPPTTPPLK